MLSAVFFAFFVGAISATRISYAVLMTIKQRVLDGNKCSKCVQANPLGSALVDVSPRSCDCISAVYVYLYVFHDRPEMETMESSKACQRTYKLIKGSVGDRFAGP